MQCPEKMWSREKGKSSSKVFWEGISEFSGQWLYERTSQLPTNQQKTFPRRISNLSWLSEPFYLSSSTFLPGVGKVIESRWNDLQNKKINGHSWLAISWFLYQPNTAIFDSKSRITWHTQPLGSWFNYKDLQSFSNRKTSGLRNRYKAGVLLFLMKLWISGLPIWSWGELGLSEKWGEVQFEVFPWVWNNKALLRGCY